MSSRYDIALGRNPPMTEVSEDVSEVQYHGWINWRVASKRELMAMGVKGEIKHEIIGETNYYSNCIITESIARKLMTLNKNFYPGAFTAIDNQGKPLPRNKQILWSQIQKLMI